MPRELLLLQGEPDPGSSAAYFRLDLAYVLNVPGWGGGGRGCRIQIRTILLHHRAAYTVMTVNGPRAPQCTEQKARQPLRSLTSSILETSIFQFDA